MEGRREGGRGKKGGKGGRDVRGVRGRGKVLEEEVWEEEEEGEERCVV